MTERGVSARTALGLGVAVVIALAWLLLRPSRPAAFPAPSGGPIVLDVPVRAR